MNDHTLNLYVDVYHGAKMGIEAIDALMKNTEYQDFQQELLKTQNKYKTIERKADKAIQHLGGIPHEISTASRMMTQGMVMLRTMWDDSPENISRMVLKGFDTAVKEISSSMEKNENATSEARDLAFSLLEMQQEDMGTYTKYLS